MIKVALIARSSLFSVKGGDTTQVVRTAAELVKAGVQAEIFKASERIRYTDFDLLHFFNIIRPSDHLYHIRKSGKPYVVSTIYLDYTQFDRQFRRQPYRTVFRVLGKHPSEFLKNIYRFSRKQDVLVSPEYMLGHRRAMKRVLKGAGMLLPNSVSEYRRIDKDLRIDKDYMVVPNGIDEDIFSHIPAAVERKEKVLCVAQVYGMKNQHALIAACEKLAVPLEIIGKPPPNHTEYYDYCRKISGKGVTFFDHMPQEELVMHYASSKVHALPSWFETTGLSSLEAGAMGCNLVVGTGGDTKDYFGDLASYCTAGDPQSIETAVKLALETPSGDQLRNKILSEYTWKKAAEATKAAYERVLNDER